MKKSNKNQKRADQILKDHPKENTVFITEDGQPFFLENKAKNHAKANDMDDPEVFFREGTAPENDKELEEALLEAENHIAVQQNVIDQVKQSADLDGDPVEVDNDTDEVVVQVVQLRENYEAIKAELEAVKSKLDEPKEEKSEQPKKNNKK